MRRILIIGGICVLLTGCANVAEVPEVTTIFDEQMVNVTEAETTTEQETTTKEPMLVDAMENSEFCEEELAEILRLIGDEELYQEYFVDTVNAEKNWGGGFECEIAHGPTARIYVTGEKVDEEHYFFIMLGADGSIYMKFGTEKIGFKSNVEGATEIPSYAIF